MGCGIVKMYAIGAGGGQNTWAGGAPMPSQLQHGGNCVLAVQFTFKLPSLGRTFTIGRGEGKLSPVLAQDEWTSLRFEVRCLAV